MLLRLPVFAAVGALVSAPAPVAVADPRPDVDLVSPAAPPSRRPGPGGRRPGQRAGTDAGRPQPRQVRGELSGQLQLLTTGQGADDARGHIA